MNWLSPPEKEATVSNRIIETASFMIPSPKTIEKIFGCVSYLRMLTAAITSEEHIRAQKSMISILPRVKGTVLLLLRQILLTL